MGNPNPDSSPVLFEAGNTDIPEAPRHILRSVEYESNYRATFNKRYSQVTPSEFVSYSNRFISLCDELYRGSGGGLVIDDFCHEDIGEPAPELPLNDQSGPLMDMDKLSSLFETSQTIRLSIRPLTKVEGLEVSFATVEWKRYAPNVLFFYAQDVVIIIYITKIGHYKACYIGECSMYLIRHRPWETSLG